MVTQKIRSDSFTSFSVLGLVILLVVGGLLIGVSYMLDSVVHWILNRKNVRTYQRLEWNTNETLQLQRLAHEEAGFGTWTGAAGDNPVTAPGERLATLNISDPKHPRLEHSSAKLRAASLEEKCATKNTGDSLQPSTTSGLTQVASGSESNSNSSNSTSHANDSQALHNLSMNNGLRRHPTW